MRFSDVFRGMFAALSGNRLRALLTLLGIMIGTGSLVALAGLLRGAEEALVALNQGINDSSTVRIRQSAPPARGIPRTRRPLSASDGEALEAIGGLAITSETSRDARAVHLGKDKRVRLMGVGLDAPAMYRLTIAQGRFVDAVDLVEGRRVVVIGDEVYTQLFGADAKVLGTQLRIADESWTIIGVLAHKPAMGHGNGTGRWDRRVMVPRSAFDATYSPSHQIQSLLLRARGVAPAESTMRALADMADAILMRRHDGVRTFEVEDRNGNNQEKSILVIIQALLMATGLMSLFVGGINIMNIMLVTVTERTREIGIRRAIGASPRAIMLQFVTEAAAISLLGGALGVMGGLLFAALASAGLDHALGSWRFHAVPWSIALGLALAIGTGVVFGLFPAWRAAQLDPVDALRGA